MNGCESSVYAIDIESRSKLDLTLLKFQFDIEAQAFIPTEQTRIYFKFPFCFLCWANKSSNATRQQKNDDNACFPGNNRFVKNWNSFL